MDAALPSPPPDSNDVFSLSDQVLSDRLHFIEEARRLLIGFGNWGSVWLCKPKPSTSASKDGFSNAPDQKLAVKLVHRSKTSTTAARVRSLWNEMKIVRTFKSDPHPSIIPFHSFIITPSYALITIAQLAPVDACIDWSESCLPSASTPPTNYIIHIRAYLPVLVPVEVDEIKAREWFRFLLSGVEFLHKRGVVHNDIKPANILLSHKNIPVLVDFGFAEKYDLKSDTAFHSNLSYGTPEYLSPERARGLPHDTRKSDIWSLGVTFFEILIGRTPFENSDGEQFTTKDDLERYWSRTLRGKWVGEYRMSKGIERMLRRMIAPNADLRCTATQVMNDSYWAYRKDRVASPASISHRRSASYTSSIVFEKDIVKLMEATRPWMEEELPESPPGLDLSRSSMENSQIPQLSRVRSQPKIAVSKPVPRKRVPPIIELSPVKGSPPSSPFSNAAGKENIRAFNALAASTSTRRPLGNIANRENLPASRTPLRQTTDTVKDKDVRKSRVLGDLTTRHRNAENTPPAKAKKDPVRDRVKEWERERERMREMERLEEIQRERYETMEKEKEEEEKAAARKRQEVAAEKENRRVAALPTPSPTLSTTSGISPLVSSFTTGSVRLHPCVGPFTDAKRPESLGASRRSSVNESGVNVLKHNIRKSIDKTVNLYKSSAAQMTGRSTPLLTLTAVDDERSPRPTTRESWEDDILLHSAPSGLPSVRQAARDERVAADARTDRMTIWMRNVEKVVEDARNTFASSSSHELTTLPSLPVAPLSRSQSRTNRSSRLPRKVLAASQIFVNENDQTFDLSNATSSYATAANSSAEPVVESHGQMQFSELQTPRKRRATVSICTPEKTPVTPSAPEADAGSPSKRREKSKSHGNLNLFQRHIAPISLLEAELNKTELHVPPSAHRLSDVLDSSLFIAPPLSPRPSSDPREEGPELDMRDISLVQSSTSFNDLTSSPLHVEPYPSRRASMQVLPDTPTQRRVEGVYDRFLMATSGVKRLGKGYQSDNTGPVTNRSLAIPAPCPRPEKRVFHSSRRPMPAAVSSDDLQRRAVSVDELGVISRGPVSSDALAGHTTLKDDGNKTSALVRRAIKAFVPGKSTSRRLSRIA
ncbi:hypothetical protein DXG01_014842 [Tephrocybe rancida]|nr:hypothetical protein DXG01_014842 [Tephrocybe rancida]